MITPELQLRAYINPNTNEIQLYRYVIQDKLTNRTLYDETEGEILKFYSKEQADQFIAEQAYVKSDLKILKVGANTIADLTVIEQLRRKDT